MSPWISGLIGAVVATALALVAERWQKPARADAAGWKALRPGWLLNGMIAGCLAMTALGCTFLVVGSSRPDADMQMLYAIVLTAVSGLGALHTLWNSYGRAISWKGDMVKYRSILGRESLRRLSEVSAVTKSEMRGAYRLTFRDGSRLRLSAYLHGAEELVARLPSGAHRH